MRTCLSVFLKPFSSKYLDIAWLIPTLVQPWVRFLPFDGKAAERLRLKLSGLSIYSSRSFSASLFHRSSLTTAAEGGTGAAEEVFFAMMGSCSILIDEGRRRQKRDSEMRIVLWNKIKSILWWARFHDVKYKLSVLRYAKRTSTGSFGYAKYNVSRIGDQPISACSSDRYELT